MLRREGGKIDRVVGLFQARARGRVELGESESPIGG